MKKVWVARVAGALFVIVAVREWVYREQHPYAHSLSGELIVLAVAAAAISFVVAEVAREISTHEDELAAIWRKSKDAPPAGPEAD